GHRPQHRRRRHRRARAAAPVRRRRHRRVNRSGEVTSAADVLRANDRGTFTVPSGSLYPYQWLWDAAFIALGWSTIDRSRAWDELDSVVRGQWSDGMLPHVVYHHPTAQYFPD